MLYLTTVLIWGSSWLAAKLQLTQVPPVLSAGYRFCLASAILLVLCILTKRSLRLSRRDHFFLVLQGVTLFGLSYCLGYLAMLYLTSGLVAVVYSTILMFNILNLKLFMGQPVARRALIGGIIGLIGIGIIFWNDFTDFTTTDGIIGLSLSFGGAYFASLGNVVGSRNADAGIPVTQANFFAMAYGGLLNLIIHFGCGGVLTMDWSPGYLGPLFFLIIFGSVLAFGCYMSLIGRIGADYAAYATMLMPVLALALSTFFEDFQWTLGAATGVCLVAAGNIVILTPARMLSRLVLLLKTTAQKPMTIDQ